MTLWTDSIKQARKALDITGFSAIKKGTPLYKKAKELHAGKLAGSVEKKSTKIKKKIAGKIPKKAATPPKKKRGRPKKVKQDK